MKMPGEESHLRDPQMWVFAVAFAVLVTVLSVVMHIANGNDFAWYHLAVSFVTAMPVMFIFAYVYDYLQG